jgi:hypothetical protein
VFPYQPWRGFEAVGPAFAVWSAFIVTCGENATILLEEALMVYLEDSNGGRSMRLLIICAIVITAGVGLAGCFHHQQAVVAEPISHTPLK